jgi:hypothetical protein
VSERRHRAVRVETFWFARLQRQAARPTARRKRACVRLFLCAPVLDIGSTRRTNTFVQRELGDVLIPWENEAGLRAKSSAATALRSSTPFSASWPNPQFRWSMPCRQAWDARRRQRLFGNPVRHAGADDPRAQIRSSARPEVAASVHRALSDAACSTASSNRADDLPRRAAGHPLHIRCHPRLSSIVLLPLAMLALRPWSLGLVGMWHAIADPRVLAALRLSLGAATIAAALNLPLGLLIAWGHGALPIPGRNLADSLIDMPRALPPRLRASR